VVEITLSGDTLIGDMARRGKTPLVAQRRRLFVKHVSGDYQFARK